MRVRPALVPVIVLVVAACGGGAQGPSPVATSSAFAAATTPTPSPSPALVAAAASTPAPSPAATGTATATATPPPTPAPTTAPPPATVAPTPVPTAAPTAFALDPCALLTSADVQPLVGAAVGQRAGGSCTYPLGRVGGVSLSLLPGKARFVEAQGYPGAMSVSGVGDQAVYVPGLGELWFLKGDLSLTVKAIGLNVEVTLDVVRPLALKVLARM